MGLGAPRRRNKLSQDPNNTEWSKSDKNYGHKILSAQGWKPGDYLGAENASHSDHYTIANASHIKILLREENLGLGAQIGKGNAETFGLSLFSGVLGRLNGKSDVEVEKQQSALRDAELRHYHAKKHGLLNFVSGGLLVGDTIRPVSELTAGAGKKRRAGVKDEAQDDETKRQKSDRDMVTVRRPKTTISTGESASGIDDSGDHKGKRRRRRDRKADSRQSSPEVITDSGISQACKDDIPLAGLRKNTKTRVVDKKFSKGRESNPQKYETSEHPEDDVEPDKTRTKSERRIRREERRQRKEEKRLAKASKEATTAETTGSEQPRRDDTASVEKTMKTGGNRHTVRQRYIQQKRMASLDPQALKEIFMLKASA